MVASIRELKDDLVKKGEGKTFAFFAMTFNDK